MLSDAYKREVLDLIDRRLDERLRSVETLPPTAVAEAMLAAVPVIETAHRMAVLVGPCYDSAGVAAVLGGPRSRPVSKQAIATRRRRQTILALATTDGRWVYPTFQFADGVVREDVVRLLATFHDAPRWSVAAWFQTPAVDLGDRTPIAWLMSGRPVEDVVRLAGHAVGRWAA